MATPASVPELFQDAVDVGEEVLLVPGHLGDLTRHLPVELVDSVLEAVPLNVDSVSCLRASGCTSSWRCPLFPSLDYLRVWDKLTAGLASRNACRPSEKALRCLRRRLGPLR
ncbi:transposase domain-containing protein [Streptomyces sp. NPDC006283]|uniref:transposase domain-containing protein n=1 Tax=Streptomyces sp. NPDC006283 TaxID=3156741 RepID=UPI0033AADDDB